MLNENVMYHVKKKRDEYTKDNTRYEDEVENIKGCVD